MIGSSCAHQLSDQTYLLPPAAVAIAQISAGIVTQRHRDDFDIPAPDAGSRRHSSTASWGNRPPSPLRRVTRSRATAETIR